MRTSVTGHVRRQLVSAGSKSEHEAIVIGTADDDYVLRRMDGNPFFDPLLDELVGKDLEVEGEVEGRNLIITTWRERAT